MPRPAKVPPETLIADYTRDLKSLRTISTERGVDVEHVRLTLKKHGIPRRPHGSNDKARQKHGLITENFWNDERVEILKGAIAAGDSAAMAGRALGISRNACNGKAARLGLKFGGYSAAAMDEVKRARIRAGATRIATVASRPKPAPKPKPKPVLKVVSEVKQQPYTERPNNVASPNPVTLDNLTPWTCRWVTQTDPYLYCGNACTETYCPGHRKLAYVPDDPRNNDRHIRFLAKNF